ncbi:hypothetical protein ACN20G_23385 [Streptomyces sp. BI20]|uniref:hypothetical protein n=1 Tax=Streptomyces sp. BI20 TaxID=3403460 RepID=UPI003C784097
MRNHIVRILGALAALTPWLVGQFPHVPWEAVTSASIALLGGAEYAQRVENGKTRAALEEPSSWEAAALAQNQLAQKEAAKVAAGEPRDGDTVQTPTVGTVEG